MRLVTWFGSKEYAWHILYKKIDKLPGFPAFPLCSDINLDYADLSLNLPPTSKEKNKEVCFKALSLKFNQYLRKKNSWNVLD